MSADANVSSEDRKPDSAAFSAHEYGGHILAFGLAITSALMLVAFAARFTEFFSFPDVLSSAVEEDLLAFFRGGEMALAGNAEQAYVPELFTEPFGVLGKGLLFLNPPHAFLFFAPWSAFGYPVAKAIYLALAFGCTAYLANKAMPGRGIVPFFVVLFSPALLLSFDYMQLSPLITACLVFALLNARSKPIVSGILLAFATIKPQYGVLVPVFLIARGDWRCFGAAAVATIALVGVSIAVFGAGVWQTFIASILGGEHLHHIIYTYTLMVTAGQSVAKWGGGAEVRLLLQVLATLLAAGVVVWAARTRPPGQATFFFLMAAALAAPSFMLYDWPHVAIALLFLLRERSPWPVSLQLQALHLWVVPLSVPLATGYLGFHPMTYSACVPLFLAIFTMSAAYMLLKTGSRNPQQEALPLATLKAAN